MLGGKGYPAQEAGVRRRVSVPKQENRDIVRRYAQMFDTGDLNEADELFAPDFIVRHLDAPELDRGGWKEFSRPFVSGFSERRLAVEGLVTEGDQVVARMTFSGRHTGEFFGIAPTEREVRFTGIVWFRIAEGKIVEHWGEFDALGLMQQLGIMERPSRQ
jgi:predicted ester cyclase